MRCTLYERGNFDRTQIIPTVDGLLVARMQRVFTFRYSTKPKHRACSFPTSIASSAIFDILIALTTIRAIPLPRPFRQISGHEFHLRKRTI